MSIEGWQMDISCRPDNKQDFAFARRFFYLMGKVTTNRNLRIVRAATMETTNILEKGGLTWLGFDAIRWVREDTTRLLFDGGCTIRPLEG